MLRGQVLKLAVVAATRFFPQRGYAVLYLHTQSYTSPLHILLLRYFNLDTPIKLLPIISLYWLPRITHPLWQPANLPYQTPGYNPTQYPGLPLTGAIAAATTFPNATRTGSRILLPAVSTRHYSYFIAFCNVVAVSGSFC